MLLYWQQFYLSPLSLAYLGTGDNAADYRDVLYWAEYQATDPMFRARDPKPVVDDLLGQWGDKK